MIPMPLRNKTTRNTFGALLAQTARQWRRAADLRLQPYGLTEATWLPLVRIARAPASMRQKDLAASLSLDNSSVVRLLDNLETAGLIRRQEEASGRTVADKVEAVAHRVREDALAGLSDADIETAFRVLDHVCRALATTTPETTP
jgi:MarR family transcriptional regulator, transcriptional regulator for hemolysin